MKYSIYERIACLFFALSLGFNALYAQSYDKLKSLQSLAVNANYRHVAGILQSIPNLNKAIVRNGCIADGIVEENRLLIDLSMPQVEYLRIKTNVGNFNTNKLTLNFDEKSIECKKIYNCEGLFFQSLDDANKYNRILSSGNSYELALLNNIALDKNAPWLKYFHNAIAFDIARSRQNKDIIKTAFYSEEIKKLESILPTLLKKGEFVGQIGDFSIKISTKNKLVLDSIYYEHKFGSKGYVCVEFPADFVSTRSFYCDDFFNWNYLINKNPTYEVALHTINGNTFLRPTSEFGEYIYRAKVFKDIFFRPLKSINGKSVSDITAKEFDEMSKNTDSLNIILQNDKLYKINKLDSYDKLILAGAMCTGIPPDIFF